MRRPSRCFERRPSPLLLAALALALAGAACSSGSGNGGAGSSGASAGTPGTSGGNAGSGGSGTPSGGSDAGAGAVGASAGSAGAGGSSTGGSNGDAGSPAGGGGGGTGGASGASGVVTWETRRLSELHFAEGADVGDIDGDGALDLVAGPNWYKAPDFALGGTLMANPPSFTRDQYSSFFLTFVDDLNADGRPDVIAVADAGIAMNTVWYENPGPSGLAGAWTRRALFNAVSNESPAYVNLVGDAKRELVFMTNRELGYARPGASATAAWSFTALTSGMFNTPFVHGLGAGDVDGDGLADLVERSGWWRQVTGATWERHAFDFAAGANKTQYSNWGGAQMQVFDVDGDGDNDVVTGLAAHQYGLSWFERQGTGASITFVPHSILPAAAGANNVSQLHSLVAADVNGDGLTDLVTGKRYYAHPSTNPDPGTTDPPVLAWFELQRGASGASFVQHVIHADSGAGCNFVVRDLNGDEKPDVFTTNKRGTFLHLQR